MAKYHDVIVAGFGGQGVMLLGNVLAQAGMEYGLNVTFIPVYGAEMRGGTANCTVVLDEHPVGSPIVQRPQSTIVLNVPSLNKFQPRLREGGVQIVNSSLIDVTQEGVLDVSKKSVCIPVNTIALELGSVKMANMVALGAWLQATQALPLESVQEALYRVAPPHYAKLIPNNKKALQAGYDYAG